MNTYTIAPGAVEILHPPPISNVCPMCEKDNDIADDESICNECLNREYGKPVSWQL